MIKNIEDYKNNPNWIKYIKKYIFDPFQWFEVASSLNTVSFPISFTASLYSAELCYHSLNSNFYTASAIYYPTLNNAVFYARACITSELLDFLLFCLLLGY